MLTDKDTKELEAAAKGSLPEFTAKARTWYITKKLAESDNHIATAAEAMGVTRWALYSAMKTLEIE
jgi:transcriptional regulator with PAS, ATPase and Fis domain